MHFQAAFAGLWIFTALIFSAVASWWLYRNNPLNLPNRRWNIAIAGIRFITLWVICLLLLEPVVRWLSIKKEKPVLVLAIDNSESMLLHPDSVNFKKEFASVREELQNKLSGTFEIETYAIGSSGKRTATIDFTEKLSNLSAGLNQIEEDHINLNHAATLLISDGIFNRGENPVYANPNSSKPVFCLGTGDTLQHKDLAIGKVQFNNRVFVGNDFEVKAEIKAFSYVGEKAMLNVFEGERLLSSFTIPIQNNHFYIQQRIPFSKASEGIHTYTLKLANLPDEHNRNNNQVKIQLQVLREMNKAVLVFQRPHPDVAAIGRCLQNHPNLKLFTYSLSDYKDEYLREASLFILHQIPGRRGEGQALLLKIKSLRIPVVQILGQQSGIPFLAGSGLLKINGPQANFNEALGWFNTEFNLFNPDENLLKSLPRFSPLSTPYGTYQIPVDAGILLYQQIGNVKTKLPLLFFSQAEGTRQAFLCGEGFWKWNLQEQLLNGNQLGTQNLISQVVKWVGNRGDKSKFRVFPQKTFFEENEEVTFEAELYNDLFERITGPEITLKLKNTREKSLDYVFQLQDNTYSLNTGILAPGDYIYEASVSGSSSYPRKKGGIHVREVRTEALQTRADHGLLRDMAQTSGGVFFPYIDYQKVVDVLLKDERMHTVVHEKTENQSLLNLKILCFLLVFLLTLEWVVRKWQGHI